MIKLSKMPPSVNGLYSTDWKTKRRFTSKNYAAWLSVVLIEMLTQPRKQYEGVVRLKIRIGPGRSNADCSNYIKPIEDLLVKHGIIQDDCKKHVKGVCIEWADVEGVEIDIIET